MNGRVCILGAGVTGLAAGLDTGRPVYEATDAPGGICSSYYLRAGTSDRLPYADHDAYRFELGGGHWIFGGDPVVLQCIADLTPAQSYTRKAAVYLPARDVLAPYPIQNHLRCLGPQLAARVLDEMAEAASASPSVRTMADWLHASFGPTLCDLFFDPFHHLYTAGLWDRIAPQDSYKSPVDLSLVRQGASGEARPVGYNVTFVYPREGLNVLAQRMAARCDVRYDKRVVRIDVKDRVLFFQDESTARYDTLVSTLPLDFMMEATGLAVDEQPNPAPSVLVVNLGAKRGPRCPAEHWIYVPESRPGFHRVGFYSNVDPSFLPAHTRGLDSHVSVYVEKAYPARQRPTPDATAAVCADVVNQLQEWSWIRDVDVVDPTWIDVAYTWSWPGSGWTRKALRALESQDIYQVGRFARWTFQGIADSIRDGFMVQGAIRTSSQV